MKAGPGIQIKNDTISNTNPDKVLLLTGTGTTKISGSYPNFTIHSDSAKLYSAGAGLSLSGSTFSALNTTSLWNANQLQGKPLSSTAPTANQILRWNNGTSLWEPSNEISYSASGSGLSLTGTTFSAQNTAALWNAIQLQGKPLSSTAPTANQILRWNNGTSLWEPSAEISYSASGSGLSLSGTTFTAMNSTALWNASQLQGNNVSSTSPTSSQILKWNSGTSVWEPSAEISYSVSGSGLSLSGTTFSVQNSTALWNANQLQGKNISTTTPANKQVLRWNATSTQWEPALDSNYWTRRNTSTYTTDSVGIGGAPVGGKLYVNGNIRMNDGNQAAGRVMVSDANGKASWGVPFTFYKLDGYVGASIAASSTAWNMVGPSVTVTVNAGQRITYVVEAPLGTSSGTASFEYDLVYQNTSSVTNPIINMVGGNYSIAQVSTVRTPFVATGSYVFTTAGTYKISYGVYNISTTAMGNNDYLNGWFMITDM
jgi:hypothetical protein